MNSTAAAPKTTANQKPLPLNMIWTPRPIPLHVPQRPTWRQLEQPQHGFFIPGCVCCFYGEDECPLCDPLLEYEIEADHLTDGSCSTCEAWNGTFVLKNALHTDSDLGEFYEDAPCTWWSDEFAESCLTSGHWFLSIIANPSGPGLIGTLLAGTNNFIAKWGSSDFNCEGETELTFGGFSGTSSCNVSMDPITITSL